MFNIINKKFIIYLVVTGILASSAFFLFPQATAQDSKLALAIAFASTITQLVAVWYFLSSLKTFKRGLRLAYYLLAGGIFVFSLVQLLPTLTLFAFVADFFSHLVVAYMVFITPYALGAMLMYLGMRSFARLLGVKFIWSSFFFALAVSFAFAVPAGLLPHADYAAIDHVALAQSFGVPPLVHLRQS